MDPLLKLHTVNVLGIDVFSVRMAKLINICKEHIDSKKTLLLGVVNVAKLVNCRKNVELQKSLMEADIVLADGLPIIWFSRMLGDVLPERVTGIDIMYELLKEAKAEILHTRTIAYQRGVLINSLQMKYDIPDAVCFELIDKIKTLMPVYSLQQRIG